MMVTRVEFLQIRYSMAEDTPAVNGVSLTVHRGEVVAVIGPSGSGKTSVARFLVGALAQHGAKASWQHFDQPHTPAMVEQEAQASLHPLLRVGRQLRDCLPQRGDPAGVLTAVGLDSSIYARRYPCQLSGGEAQRVAIARALALDADLIVADEITANLDVIATMKVLEALRRVVDSRSVGCILVTHDLEVCRAVANRVVVLREGVVIGEGSPRDLLPPVPGRLL